MPNVSSSTTPTSDVESSLVIVVGAGLAGSMCALLMAQRGYTVEIYEKRSDFRESSRTNAEESTSAFGQSQSASKRSINLALSTRGRAALRKVGLEEKVMEFALPMHSRAIHVSNNIVIQPYGTSDQAIYSVDRNKLNLLLLSAALDSGNVSIFFNCPLTSLEATGAATFGTGASAVTKHPRLVIGSDGAYSSVRTFMSRHLRQNYSQYYIPHGYKELTIPPLSSGDFALSPENALHIWPRKEFMMIALPNPDKSFTATIFAPYRGDGGFDTLTSRADIRNHFTKYFPDVLPLMPNYVEEYLTNPTGALATMKVDPWHVEDRILLLGDAAHAIVPFYGQGMNAAFEDCLVLDELLDSFQNDLSRAVPAFARNRIGDTAALATLSFDNYVEMRDRTASVLFRLKSKIDAILHYVCPAWIPLYTMVSFSRIRYATALAKSKSQDKILSMVTKAIVATSLVGVSTAIAMLCGGSSRNLKQLMSKQ